MAGQLIPPPELAPPVPHGLTPQQRIALWVDLLDAGEQFLLGGLRREIGPNGDLQAAYRQWYAQRREEHDRAIFHMLKELSNREVDRAR